MIAHGESRNRKSKAALHFSGNLVTSLDETRVPPVERDLPSWGGALLPASRAREHMD